MQFDPSTPKHAHRIAHALFVSFALATLVFILGSTVACRQNTGDEANNQTQKRFEFREAHLGTHASLIFYAPNEAVANRAATAAYDRIRQLDAVFSTYRGDSEIEQLRNTPTSEQSNTDGIAVSNDLWAVLNVADRVHQASNGAFDVTVGHLARVWKRAIRQRKLPDEKSLQSAMETVGWQHVQMDKSRQSVRLNQPGMRLDLAALAKGYIADEALAALQSHDCDSALVDLGGDLAIGDKPPGKDGWRVAILASASTSQTPRVVSIHNCGLATSGDTFQFVEIDGVRYSHIVDPRTGQATTHSLTASVIAPTTVLADALASAASVLGTKKGAELIDSLEGCEASLAARTAESEPQPAIQTRAFPAFCEPTTKPGSEPTTESNAETSDLQP